MNYNPYEIDEQLQHQDMIKSTISKSSNDYINSLQLILRKLGLWDTPTTFENSLSWYQALKYVLKYMIDTLIPIIQENDNKVNELVELYNDVSDYVNNELQNITDYINEELENSTNFMNNELSNMTDYINTELEDITNYVNNYFNNLNVQDEIDNKLDDMLEQGVLTNIITQYLQLSAFYGYNTVADMKLSENLANGSFAKTLGFHSIGDGGEASYKIRTKTNDDTIDEMTIIALYDNTLVAEFIKPNIVNVHQLGAYGDGEHDDTDALKKAISISKMVDLSGYQNIYKVTSTITISSDNKIIRGRGSVIVNEEDFEGTNIFEITGQYVKFDDVGIGCTNPSQTITAFYINGFTCLLNRVTVTGSGQYCVAVEKAEARLLFSKFRGFRLGVLVHAPDLYCEDIYCEQCTATGFYCNGTGSMELHHVHSYGNTKHGFYLNGANYSNLYGCYADTNGANGFEIHETANSNFYGCWAFKSATSESAYGFALYGVSNCNFNGCFSTAGQEYIQASWKIGSTSNYNVLDVCHASSAVDIDGVVLAQNCKGNLKKYNIGYEIPMKRNR